MCGAANTDNNTSIHCQVIDVFLFELSCTLESNINTQIIIVKDDFKYDFNSDYFNNHNNYDHYDYNYHNHNYYYDNYYYYHYD